MVKTKGTFNYRGEPVSFKALAVTVFVSMGGYIFGYDIGYISGCLIMDPFLRDYGTLSAAGTYEFSKGRQAIIVAILSLGSFAGALTGVPVADFAGRRGAIFALSALFILGVIIQVAPSRNEHAFLAGRFLAGMAFSILLIVIFTYLFFWCRCFVGVGGEVSPKSLRGAFVSFYQIMITLGILVAYCLDYATHSINGSAAYKIPIGLQAAWGLILCCGCPFLPKSPRESVLNGKIDDALHTVSSMHGLTPDDPYCKEIVAEIQEKITEEQKAGASYIDCFRFGGRYKTGQRTLIGMCVQSFQQLTGANFIFYYGTSIFQGVNPTINSYQSQIIFGLLDMIGTIPGLYCLDRFGRRRTMITGAIVMGLSYMLYAVIGSYALYPNNNPANAANKPAAAGFLFVVCIFVLGYGCSWGPGGWVNTGEIAPLRTKAKQLSFIAASNWTWNFLLSYFSPYIADAIGAKYGFVFFGANFAAAAFIYCFVPEMSGLSLEEINTMFEQGIPARKSFKWNRELIATHHKNDSEKTLALPQASENVTSKSKKEKSGATSAHVDEV